MTLHLYLARRFLWRFLALFAAFFALATITDATGLLGQFDNQRVGLLETLRLALLQAPNGVYQLLSIITILASLVLFLGLSRSSELVTTRAAGLSAFQTLAAPTLTALVLGIIAVVALNPLASASLRKFESDTGRYRSNALSAFSLSRKGLWLRQGSPRGQMVIFAERANFDATRLLGVTFWELSKKGIAVRRITAARASLIDGAWRLGPGRSWEIGRPDEVPDRTARNFDSLTLPSDLTSSQILDSFGNPSTVSVWETPAFIERLRRAGLATRRHEVHFQAVLALPLLLAAMVMIGAAFSMQHVRGAGRGAMILLTVMTGLGIYIIQNFAEILGANGAVPVLAAAWGTPVAAILFATGLVLHMEDG